MQAAWPPPPVEEEGLSEPPGADSDAVALPPGAEAGTTEPPNDSLALPPGAGPATQAAAGIEPAATTQPASQGYWIGLGVGALALAVFYGILSYARLEVFKMLLSSFFPLLVLITAVLGSIVFGLATPTEAAAVGALGGFLLAAAYRQLTFNVVKESVFLTAKTSARGC